MKIMPVALMSGAMLNVDFRRLLGAQILSVLGAGLTTIALALLAFDLAGEAAGAVLGTALAIKMVAYVGLAPVAAALSARLPRKPFLITLDLMRAALVLLLPFVTQVWQIYVLVFSFQALSAAFTPSFQAVIPDILTDEADYTEALSYSRLTYDLEALLSPMLAGLVLMVASFHVLFLGTALGFLGSALLVRRAVFPDRSAGTTQRPFGDRVTRGLRIYLATPRLRGLLALYLAVATGTAMVIVNTVVHVKSDLGHGDDMVALFYGASGVGSMMVAILLPRLLAERPVRPVVMAGGAILTAGMACAGVFAPGMLGGLLLWLLLGAGASLIQTPSGLLIMRSCAEEDRSALFAAQFALSHATWLLAYPLAGRLGQWLGVSGTFLVMAAIAGAGTLLAHRLWPVKTGKTRA